MLHLQVGLDRDIRWAVGDEEAHPLVLDERGRRSDVLLLHGHGLRLSSGDLTNCSLHSAARSVTVKLSLYFHTTHDRFLVFF